MDNNLQRTRLADGIHFNSFTDDRYKVNRVSVAFMTKQSNDTAAAYALLANILTKKNATFPNEKDFHNYEASLYASEIHGEAGCLGDVSLLDFSVSSISDKFALEGEPISEQAAGLLLDCILRPAFQNGVFTDIETEKQNQIRIIEAELNDKQEYAHNKGIELLCPNEPFSVNTNGTIDTVNALTPSTLLSAYKELLSHARIEIICVGRDSFSHLLPIFQKEFDSLTRGDIDPCVTTASPIAQTVNEVTDIMSVVQGKMVIGLKTDYKNKAATSLMNKIYGGMVTSKLFLNVREKLSLCYYCWSRYNRYKDTFTVDCGVEKENIGKARAEILKQLDDMRSGDFADTDIEVALMALRNDTNTVNDSAATLAAWYTDRIYRGDVIAPAEALAEYEAVTREQIVEAANAVKLSAVYVLSGEEGEKE
ncbi:MAG: insulinase family protein [Oscillospiraceae bacterium]|jgi:predicted Zn-dependent peptidase|nr:insulinase family protein [Oscillospiraceae bacterium]